MVKIEGFIPSTGDPIIYLNRENHLTALLSRIEGAGGKISMPNTQIE